MCNYMCKKLKLSLVKFYFCGQMFRVCLSMIYKPENWRVVENMETHRYHVQIPSSA
jgi:hypothetical protein